MSRDEELRSLRDALEDVAAKAGKQGFRETAKMFEGSLKDARLLLREDRAELWDRYQSLWENHRRTRATLESKSELAKARYASQLDALDYRYDGAPIGQTFENWERVGEKIRSCRAEIKTMQASLKADAELLSKDRQEIYDRINIIWLNIKASEDVTFSVHAERAHKLADDAHRAVQQLRVRDAAPIVKAAAAEVRSLWLERGLRDRMRSWFDNLFQQLSYKYEEGKRKHEDWRVRQEEGLERLRGARAKAQDALTRIEANLEANRERLSTARSDGFQTRVSEWIDEGEQKVRDIEQSLLELDAKISDAEERLRG
jgi:hypothetical protein